MKIVIRMIPYPPSLSNSAAKSIDPAIGASTWAFGSHKCRPYRGAFTMNAIRRARPDKRPAHELVKGEFMRFIIVKFKVPFWMYKCIMVTNNGKELIRVYSSR